MAGGIAGVTGVERPRDSAGSRFVARYNRRRSNAPDADDRFATNAMVAFDVRRRRVGRRAAPPIENRRSSSPRSRARALILLAFQDKCCGSSRVEALCKELDLRSATIVRVLAHTGLRPGELRELTWQDVAPLGMQPVPRTVRVYAPKTNRERTVPLSSEAWRAFAAWTIASAPVAGGDPVFPADRLGWWSANA
jgi:integrase